MFIDFDICNLPATLPVLYSVTLTYLFTVKYFKCNISETVRASAKLQEMTFVDFNICYQKTAGSAVEVEPTTFRTAATDGKKY